MTYPRFICGLGFACMALLASASGDEFKLTYTFGGTSSITGNGDTLMATFNGTLDGDLITDVSNMVFTLGGTTAGGLTFRDTYSLSEAEGIVSHVPVVDAETISLDGLQNNFVFYTSSSSAKFESYSGDPAPLVFSDVFVTDPVLGISAKDGSSSGLSGVNSSWKVVDLTLHVPDPGVSLGLLSLILGGIASMRRKTTAG